MAGTTTKSKTAIDTAVRPLYAVAGATDLAVEVARGYVADAQAKVTGAQKSAQKRISSVDLDPKSLQSSATSLVSARVEEVGNRAKARRDEIEKTVTDIQGRVQALPGRVETYAKDTVSDLNQTYAELASRGEQLVTRIRTQQSSQDLKKSAKTGVSEAKATATTAEKGAKATTSRAKATRTTAKKQATKAADSSKSAAKSAASSTESSAKATRTTAKKAAKSTTSRAKATATTAKKAASQATEAAADAAEKVGD